jgi:hypothetical protein
VKNRWIKRKKGKEVMPIKIILIILLLLIRFRLRGGVGNLGEMEKEIRKIMLSQFRKHI